MDLQRRLTDQLDAFLESLRTYQAIIPPELQDDAMPKQIQIRRNRSPQVKLIRSQIPGDESSHTSLPFRALEDALQACVQDILSTITAAAPYFDTDRHEFTFQASRDQEKIRVVINDTGLQVFPVPPKEVAREISIICKHLASLPARTKIYDVRGVRVSAATPEEALSIYAIFLSPENPIEFIGKQSHTIVERHEGVLPDISLFQVK